ncbi:hypothetical protein D3P07_17455 [Paenibacillus sp. 1011MAR3C5]|uniref:hypothetical protein n=1 Tax=Paenibacillus sp. 1011MAR3C5 TaxID=1675787 RepID=UPI000E6CC345|nr:hypothetical protein [Paenibacillus sp. 1011MAR3C5]RJE86965.1 hypothetical protein D3P07_17455 [Paenibacillus sp. 1011MAR3C5]
MIWFILMFIVLLSGSLTMMIRQRAAKREIVLVTSLMLLGFADWMSILLGHKFKSSKVIALLIDLVGL